MALIRWSGIALVMCLLAMTMAATPARAQNITGSIFGNARDASNLQLPGVTVTLSSPQLIGGVQTRTTNEDGAYRFPVLPPGTYLLTFEIQGFQTLRREGVVLLAGQSLAVDAQLQIGKVREDVTVSGVTPLVDTRNSALVNIFDLRTLENIPIQREFTKILNLMPGVTDGRYDFSPVNNVHGSTLRQNVYSLDGVNTDDPNTNATAVLLPPDAFQEVQVTTAGISAEFGDASGGLFNFVTKSGGNDLHGGANLFGQTKDLQSNNVSDSLRKLGVGSGAGFDHIYDVGGLLGGPVKKDRVWYFGNYRHVVQAERRSDFAHVLDTTDKTAFVKGTVQVTVKHKAEMTFYFRDFYNFPYTTIASFRNSGDPRTWMGVNKRNYILIPRWTTVINERTLFEVRGSSSIFKLMARDPNNVGAPAYIDQATGILTGGSDQLFGDNRRNRHIVKADLSHYRDHWFGGSHNFKTGLEFGYDPVWQERFVQGARGAKELVGCTDGCISQTPDTQHLLMNGVPFRVRLWNAPRMQKFLNEHWYGYVSDQWVVRNRVTLNLGLRVEHVQGNIPESYGGPGRWEPDAITFPEQTGLIKLTDVAPRLGIVWDVASDHKTTVKATGGRFYNQLNTSHVGIATAAGIGYREYDWVDKNGDMIYQPGEEGLLRADTRPNPARLPTIDPNLKNQYTDVYTVGFERAVRSDVSVAVTAIFKQDGNLLGTVNAAVPFSSYDPITVTEPLTNAPLTIYTLRPEFVGKPGQTVLTNPGERPGDSVKLQRKYTGLEFVLRRRMQGRWQFETSYVYGNGKGNVGNAFSDSQTADYTNPNSLVNRYGPLPNTPKHQFKAMGTYLAPYGVVVSAYLELLSGISWTETFFGGGTVKGAATVRFFRTSFPQIGSETFIDAAGEPAGTRLMDGPKRFDLRFEKRVQLKKGNVSAMVDVFNILNGSAVILIRDLNLSNPNFGVPAQVQLPRQVRVGLRWMF